MEFELPETYRRVGACIYKKVMQSFILHWNTKASRGPFSTNCVSDIMASSWLRSSVSFLFIFLSALYLVVPVVAQCSCTCPPPNNCEFRPPGDRFTPCAPEERLESRSEVQANVIGLEFCLGIGVPLIDCCPDPVTKTVVSVVVVTATSTTTSTKTATATVSVSVTQKQTDTKTETKLEMRTTTVSVSVTEKQTQTKTETKAVTRTTIVSKLVDLGTSKH